MVYRNRGNFHGVEWTVLTRKDARHFSECLKARWPGTRFLSRRSYRPEDGNEEVDLESLTLSYVPYLGAPGTESLTVWVEPEGWQPRWEGPNEWGVYTVANEPRLQFQYQGLYFTRRNQVPSWDENHNELFGVQLPPTLSLADGRFFGAHDPLDKDDNEQRRFLGQVIRLFKKEVATNRLMTIDFVTGLPKSEPGKGGSIWAGHDAIAWTRRSANRFITICYRAADEYEDWMTGKIKLRYPKGKKRVGKVFVGKPDSWVFQKDTLFIFNDTTRKVYVSNPRMRLFGELIGSIGEKREIDPSDM